MSTSPDTRRKGLKRFVIQIEGVGRAEFSALTASKARWAAFLAAREAGYRLTFQDFLNRCYTLHMGRP